MWHPSQALAWDLHSHGVSESCQGPSEVHGELAIHRGPCCPAQLSPILSAALRLPGGAQESRMRRTGGEGGNRPRATVLGLGHAPPGPSRTPEGVRPVRVLPDLVGVYVSAPRSDARPREEAGRSLLPWQLGSSGSPAEALCLLLQQQGAKCACSGWAGSPHVLGEPIGQGTLPPPH